MIVTKSMFNPRLEFPNITAPISTSLNPKTMALAITPFTRIRIACIKPINPKSMPHSLSILPSVSTPSAPALHSIPIISPFHPIPFISPIHEVIINPTSVTFPLVEFTFIKVPIAIKLYPFPYNQLKSSVFFVVVVVAFVTMGFSNEPLDGLRIGFRKLESFFETNNALVDQTFVFRREEKGYSDEN